VQKPHARLTGIVYLTFFVTAILGASLAHSHNGLVMFGEPLTLFSNICYLAVGVLFYFMFKPVSHIVSLVAACCNIAGCVVGSLALYHLVSARVNPLYFFGPYCILLGFLIFRSTFLPRVLGILMMLAGVAWLISLMPALAKPVFPYVAALGIVAEAAVMLWLLIKGINEYLWKQKALVRSG